jgi:hypothetical protein
MYENIGECIKIRHLSNLLNIYRCNFIVLFLRYLAIIKIFHVNHRSPDQQSRDFSRRTFHDRDSLRIAIPTFDDSTADISTDAASASDRYKLDSRHVNNANNTGRAKEDFFVSTTENHF